MYTLLGRTEAALRDPGGRRPVTLAAKSLGEPSEWQVRAMQAAGDAIGKLRDGATLAEIRAAARRAGEGVRREFQHQEACRKVLQEVWRSGGPFIQSIGVGGTNLIERTPVVARHTF